MLKTLDRLELGPEGTALVLGCGAGLIPVALARKGTTTIGWDLSPKAIEYAKQHNHNKNVTYLVADATDFEVDHKFDIIVLPGIVDHISPSKLGKLVTNVNKHAHQGSIVHVNFMVSQFAEFSRDKLESKHSNVVDYGLLLRVFDSAGFIPVSMETVGKRSPVEYFDILFVTKAKSMLMWEDLYLNKQELPVGLGNVPDEGELDKEK
jgi:cyclopropane fatty-acyl-phospholipid synthase-like methyltransferase